MRFEAAEQVVAELAANAVLHGRVPGRDFRLRLTLRTDGALRIEVTDARGTGSRRSGTRWAVRRSRVGVC